VSDQGREKLVARGAQGEPGQPGKRGDAGVGRPVRRAIAYLFLLNFALIIAGYAWLTIQAGDSRAAQIREQAQQQQAAETVEHKLCTTLGRLAALRPPAGNPGTNPSRAYDQQVHTTLAQLGPDIGCNRQGAPR
jgi:hypothetical protein